MIVFGGKKTLGAFLWLRRVVAGCSLLLEGHAIDLDHVAAHPIGALVVYADLTEFQPRRGSGGACFAF